MKDRALIYLSLLLSVVALGYAAWVHRQGSEALAVRAVRQREAELVRHWTPRMQAVYRDMLGDPSRIPQNPATLEGLLDPLVSLMEQIGEQGGAVTNKGNSK